MDSYILEPQAWAVANFGDCRLGDKRLTDRLVAYAESVTVRPDDSTPHQTQSWKSCKATYRFMNNKKVSYDEIIRPHCERTRASATSGVWLSICDTTELSFSLKRKIKGLKPVGDGIGQGFFLHSSMLISEETGEIAGLAAQELFYRIKAPTGEGSAQRKKRKRESQVWGRVVDKVGVPHEGAQIVHICDRGADDFELYCHMLENKAGWVVRVHNTTRIVHRVNRREPEDSESLEKQPLIDIVESLPVLGTYELTVKQNKKQMARIAQVEISCCNVWVPRPTAVSPWVKKNGTKWIQMGVVQAREINAPKGATPLRWILYTHEQVSTFDHCWKTLARYEKRPIIEDYHKACKTGAQIEERLYRTNKRLERVAGVLAITAVRIVQMRTVAKIDPERHARNVVPRRWLVVLCAIQRRQHPKARHKWNPKTLTIQNFMRGVAMMGGFLGRKSDGEPGWITIWRGVKELLIIVRSIRRKRNRTSASTCG